MATALAYQAQTPLSSEVSTTLSVNAGVAFEVFADAVEIPRWLYEQRLSMENEAIASYQEALMLAPSCELPSPGSYMAMNVVGGHGALHHGGLGDGVAHLPGRTIRDEPHRIDRFTRRSGGNQYGGPLEITFERAVSRYRGGDQTR